MKINKTSSNGGESCAKKYPNIKVGKDGPSFNFDNFCYIDREGVENCAVDDKGYIFITTQTSADDDNKNRQEFTKTSKNFRCSQPCKNETYFEGKCEFNQNTWLNQCFNTDSMELTDDSQDECIGNKTWGVCTNDEGQYLSDRDTELKCRGTKKLI